MKSLIFLAFAGVMTAGSPVFACSPFNEASYDSDYLKNALSSQAYHTEIVKLGAGSSERLRTISLKDDFTVEVQLSGCGISIKGTPISPKPGERSCASFEFTAETVCK